MNLGNFVNGWYSDFVEVSHVDCGVTVLKVPRDREGGTSYNSDIAATAAIAFSIINRCRIRFAVSSGIMEFQGTQPYNCPIEPIEPIKVDNTANTYKKWRPKHKDNWRDA